MSRDIKDFSSARPFHTKMVKYLDEYAEHLLLVKSDGTSISHYTVIYEFLNYIFGHHLIFNIDQITVGIANSKFYAKYKQMNPEKISSAEIKQILKGFFTFIYGKYGINYDKIMRGFEKIK